MKKIKIIIIFFVFLWPVLFNSCATMKLESRLDPASEEFFSKVRYIITKVESKIFLELPPSGRERFIREFWARRDPTPKTAKNEYREIYYQRIEEANRLFKGARPGWLQDRGRIYILFGPPNERQTNPMGGRPIDGYIEPREMDVARRVATGEKATEIWVYYNLFSLLPQPRQVRLVFVDSEGSGDYRLTTNLDELNPGVLDALLTPDLKITHELYKQEAEMSRLTFKRALFDFSWELIKQKEKRLDSNLQVHLELPYSKIIFIEEETSSKALLKLEIQVRTASENILWSCEKDYTLNFSQQFIETNKEGIWMEDIPIARWLDKGEYLVFIRMRNLSGNQMIEKLLPVKM